MIPHSRPFFDGADEGALTDVLRRRFVTHGRAAEALGKRGARVLGRRWGIALQSGTNALTAALHLLGIGRGDRVAVSSYLCSAPLDALALVGAAPVVIDADPRTLALDVQAANELDDLSAVIAAHMFGCPAPVERIVCDRLIEDCAQTLGVSRGGRPVGSSGRLAVCSFYGTKLVAAGHGGLLAGDDPELEQAAWELFVHDNQDHWRTVRFHFLMADLAAALAMSQLAKLERFIRERRALAARYAEALGEQALIPGCAYSRFLAVAEEADEMIARFRGAGIEAKRPVYAPVHRLLGLERERYPVAEWAHEHVVSVPVYPGMAEEDTDRIIAFLRENADALRCWPPV